MQRNLYWLCIAGSLLGISAFTMAQSSKPSVATVRRVDVRHPGTDFELQIETSQPVTPQSQVITGPDRLVIDFPNSVLGPALHAIAARVIQEHSRGEHS